MASDLLDRRCGAQRAALVTRAEHRQCLERWLCPAQIEEVSAWAGQVGSVSLSGAALRRSAAMPIRSGEGRR